MASFSWSNLASLALALSKTAISELEGVLSPKVSATASTAVALAAATMGAVQSGGTAPTISAAVADAVKVAAAAGLSSQDQANLAGAGATIASFAPIAAAVAEAGLPTHSAAITAAMGVLQEVTSGVAAVTPAPAAS